METSLGERLDKNELVTDLSRLGPFNDALLKLVLKKVKTKDNIGKILWPANQSSENDFASKLRQKIDKQLIENNQNHVKFPNDFTHGLMCKHILESSAQNDANSFDYLKAGKWKIHAKVK